MLKINLQITLSCFLLSTICFITKAQTLTIPGISEITSGNVGYIHKENKTEAYYFLSVIGEPTNKDDELMDHLLTIVDVNQRSPFPTSIRKKQMSRKPIFD